MKQPVKIVILLISIGSAIAMYRLFSNAPADDEVVKTKGGTATGGALIAPDKGAWSLRRQAPGEAVVDDITATDLPTSNKHAVRLNVSQVDPEKFWAIQMLKPVPQAIRANRDLTVTFWGRSSTKTSVWVVFEQGESPHTPELQKKITLTPQWEQYEIPFRTKNEHTDPHANFCIKAGIEVGVTEVAGIYVDESK